MNGYSYIDTRANMMRCASKWPKLGIRDRVKLFDQLAPGWKRCRVTYITGREVIGGTALDVAWEIPGRITVRGWDVSGYINEQQ